MPTHIYLVRFLSLNLLELSAMTYHEQRAEVFRKLSASILTSKFPTFEAEVAKSAWNITEAAAAPTLKARRLGLQSVYYVYVLMDPRKVGPWIITLPGGKCIELPYLPFYVGKGHNRRMYEHAVMARRQPTPIRGEFKANTIRKLHRLDLDVIPLRVTAFSTEAVALAKEIILIEAAGRKNINSGPLTNLTSGGEGVANPGESTRNKIRQAAIQQHQSMTDKQKAAKRSRHSASLKLAWLSVDQDTRSIRSQKLSLSNKGRTATQETRAKMSASRVGKPGIPRTQAWKDKIGAANRGIKRTPEFIAELSRSRLGVKTGPRDPEVGRNARKDDLHKRENV